MNLYADKARTHSSVGPFNTSDEPRPSTPCILRPRRNWEGDEYAGLYDEFSLFSRRVHTNDEVAFEIKQINGIKRAVSLPNAAPEEASLADMMGRCREFMDLCDPKLFYTADWQLFFDCYREHDFGGIHPRFGPNMAFNEGMLIAEIYNNFLDHLRKEAVKRRLKKSLFDWKAGLAHQRAIIHDYLAWLVSTYDLIPVRLDFQFLESAFDDADLLERMSWMPRLNEGWRRVASQAIPTGKAGETRARIDPVQAMEYRDRFFKKRLGPERHVFERVVGHIAKMERGGKRRANHFHCIFFLDAKKGKDIEGPINALTRRWEVVTRHQGWVYNCHKSPKKHDMIANGTWALELIEKGNAHKLATLDEYVGRYFAKDKDQMLRIKPTAYSNTLTRGKFASEP